jgi:hypothetical protein
VHSSCPPSSLIHRLPFHEIFFNWDSCLSACAFFFSYLKKIKKIKRIKFIPMLWTVKQAWFLPIMWKTPPKCFQNWPFQSPEKQREGKKFSFGRDGGWVIERDGWTGWCRTSDLGFGSSFADGKMIFLDRIGYSLPLRTLKFIRFFDL